jgi:hypothetical protein
MVLTCANVVKRSWNFFGDVHLVPVCPGGIGTYRHVTAHVPPYGATMARNGRDPHTHTRTWIRGRAARTVAHGAIRGVRRAMPSRLTSRRPHIPPYRRTGGCSCVGMGSRATGRTGPHGAARGAGRAPRGWRRIPAYGTYHVARGICPIMGHHGTYTYIHPIMVHTPRTGAYTPCVHTCPMVGHMWTRCDTWYIS